MLLMYNTKDSVLLRYNTYAILYQDNLMTQQWDPESPIYLQLYQQVIKRILDGFIAEGEPVPSVRNVAAEYRINPITISKAYQMLQDENIVEKQRGKGLFVKAGAKTQILARERDVFINKEWPIVMQQIERLQLKIEDLITGTKIHIEEDK